MFSNSASKLQNVQICAYKTARVSINELRIVAAKSSDKIRTHLQEGRFTNAQENRLQVANR